MLTIQKLHSIIQNVPTKQGTQKVHWKVNNKLWETNKAVVLTTKNKKWNSSEFYKLFKITNNRVKEL